ncbi:MAG: SBBP repeat-containing protein [Bacteroidia bacterium]
MYITALTFPSDFPTANPYQSSHQGGGDVSVTILDPSQSGAAQLVYSTYLGGNDYEYPRFLALNPVNGRIYVAADTKSTNSPTINAYNAGNSGGPDGFVTVLDTTQGGTNQLIYSTYLGGSGDDYVSSLALGPNGRVYLTGFTSSSNFPLKNAYQGSFGGGDAFMAVLDISQPVSTNQLVYSTYLGGNAGDGGASIVVDGSGKAYVAGNTESVNFPTHNAYQNVSGGVRDAFLAVLNPSLSSSSSLVYSTYLGGSDEEYAGSVILGRGTAIVLGGTYSNDFPTTLEFLMSHQGDWDHFLAILDPSSGTAGLLYGTYYGGNGHDESPLRDPAIALEGNCLYWTGFGNSTTFPTVNYFQNSPQGGYDAYVVEACDFPLAWRPEGSETHAPPEVGVAPTLSRGSITVRAARDAVGYLFDALGQEMARLRLQAGTNHVDLSHLACIA